MLCPRCHGGGEILKGEIGLSTVLLCPICHSTGQLSLAIPPDTLIEFPDGTVFTAAEVERLSQIRRSRT